MSPNQQQLERVFAQLTSERLETPFYLYDADSAEASANDLSATLNDHFGPRTKLFLPVFANPCFPLLDVLIASRPEIGVLVNSLPELEAVKSYPWTKQPRVLFASGIMTAANVRHVVAEADIYYAASLSNLQTALETEHGKAMLGIRVDVSNSGELRGIRAHELEGSLSRDPSIANQVCALHAYQGPSTTGFDACTVHADALLSFAKRFPNLQQINFSGGWPFDYTNKTTPQPSSQPRLLRFLSELRSRLRSVGLTSNVIDIAFEPGKFLLAPHGYFFARVIEEIETGPSQSDVHLDASFAHLPAPKLKNRQHAVSLLSNDWTVCNAKGIFCRLRGCSGLSSDYLLPGRVVLPKPKAGDILVIHDVGVYGWAGSYNFLGLPRPAEYLSANDRTRLARRPQDSGFLLDGIAPPDQEGSS